VLLGKKWDYLCLAGKVNFVVEANGDLKICEFLPSLGNLKKNSFDELMASKEAIETLKRIKKHQCDCTHICFVSGSLNHSPWGVLKLFLKR
jgi:radical SAM protein with 4Fe4S-binding SPASM domain